MIYDGIVYFQEETITPDKVESSYVLEAGNTRHKARSVEEIGRRALTIQESEGLGRLFSKVPYSVRNRCSGPHGMDLNVGLLVMGDTSYRPLTKKEISDGGLSGFTRKYS